MKHVYIFTTIFVLSFNNLFAKNLHWNTVSADFDSIAELVETYKEIGITQPERMMMINELEKIAEKEGKQQQVLKWRALFYRALSTLDKSKSEHLLRQAIVMVDTINFRYDYMRIRSQLLSRQENAYENALKEYRERQEIMDYAIEIGDTLLIAESLLGQGLLLQHIGDNYRALHFLQQSSYYLKKIGYHRFAVENNLNISNSLFEIGYRDSAFLILKELIDLPVVQHDTLVLTQLYASLNLVVPDSIQAYSFAREEYRLSKAMDDSNLIAQASVNMGRMNLLMNNLDSAYYYYDQSWDYLRKHDNFSLLFPTLQGLIYSCLLANRQEEALEYTTIYFFYQDSIRYSKQALQISNLEQRRAIEQYEKTLAQEKELEKTRGTIFYLTAALLSLLVIGLAYIIIMQRKQSRLKEQNRQLELDAKNRELTTHELMLIEKNRMLEELEKRISEGRAQGDIDRQTAMELRSQINAHVKRDNEWQNFHIQFEQVYPEFYSSLKKVAPSLTEGELRLCAFIRTGMDNKQIAAMLSQQPDSVKKSRYRLRKKLPLATEDSLEDFLREL